VYCDDELSSMWATELNKPQMVDTEKVEALKQYILDNIQSISYVYLCGGEPLLMKQNVELLEQLLAAGKEHIQIRVNSNLASLSTKVFTLLQKFTNVHWIISGESTNSEFEYIRYHSSWDKWLNNLRTLQELSKTTSHKITFNMVWCALTATSIINTVNFFRNMGFDYNSFVIQILNWPLGLKAENLHQSTRRDILEKIKHECTTIPVESCLFKSYTNIVNYLQNTDGVSSDIPALTKFISVLDNRRSTNGLELFSHLLNNDNTN
jgi:sulfatase maturation enzyme AslB (radical SAM superfamily)